MCFTVWLLANVKKDCPVSQIKTWQPSVGAAMGLSWMLERSEGLYIGYWRGQGSELVTGEAVGSGSSLLLSAKSGPATRKASLRVCVCVSGHELSGNQGPATGCSGYLSPVTGGILSACVCLCVPACLCSSEYWRDPYIYQFSPDGLSSGSASEGSRMRPLVLSVFGRVLSISVPADLCVCLCLYV